MAQGDPGSPRGGRPVLRPTIKDVAALAGVSIKTVSRVINSEPRVSAATTQTVQAAIAQLGFRRNDGARILRQGHSATLGLVLEDFGDPFYSVLTGAVEEVVLREGYTLLTGSSAEDTVRERELILNFCARRVNGLIVVPTAGGHQYLLPEIEAGVASVFVDRPPGDLDADIVLTDNVGGARTGVEHLIRHGHRRIGFIGDRPDIFTANQRLAGYREATARARLPVDEALIEMSPPRPDPIRRALRRMLSGDNPATALFTGNGRITVAVLRELHRYGRRPALVGFDDFELADLVTPGVTVVAQDPASMGRTAAELLLRRLAGDGGPAHRISLGTTLIPRGSGEIRPGDQG